MQSTAQLINDIVIFAIFIYFILLVSRKVKLNVSRQEKFDNLMERKGTLLKILAYGGVVIFAALILIGKFGFNGTIAMCEYVTEKITSKYTYDETQKLNKKTQQEQLDSVMPIIR
jgi:hypothetical protein